MEEGRGKIPKSFPLRGSDKLDGVLKLKDDKMRAKESK